MEARKAYFMVRAEVPNESDRAKFDQWYGTHHLPLAMDNFLGRIDHFAPCHRHEPRFGALGCLPVVAQP